MANAAAIPATLIRGDGIGPEVIDASVRVLDALGLAFEWDVQPAGQAAIDQVGTPLPPPTIESIRRTKTCFKGPLSTPIGGGYKSVNVLLRQELQLFANVRPVRSFPGVPSRYENVDLVVVRENTEGMYAGIERWQNPEKTRAETVSVITREGSERVLRFAFEYVKREKRRKLTVIHKANILKATSGLFLATAKELAREYPDVPFEDLIIDNACMQLVRDPTRYDVIVTTNLFGDILSDLTAGLVGGLGVAPGANIGYGNTAIFEAVHGTAPDIAGQGIANPGATMLAAVLMLRHLGKREEADRMHTAVCKAFENPVSRTPDLGGRGNTQTFTQAVLDGL